MSDTPRLHRLARLGHWSRVAAFALAPFAATCLVPGAAEASKPRLHVDRVDPSDKKHDELHVYASVIELEGNVVEDLAPGQFTLLVDGKPRGRAIRAQAFEGTQEEVNAVFVIEVSALYKKDLETLKGALKDFLDDPPRKLRGLLVSYSTDFDTRGALTPAAAVSDQVDDLSCDDDSADLRLVDAVNAALVQLNKLPNKEGGGPPPRRMIVLVSDGLNNKMDRNTFKALGDRAAAAGVPIHSIAFSPNDDRGPLLNLGELSKRSSGTFRWARSAADLKPQLATLTDEIKKQYVLSFKLDWPNPEEHRYRLQQGELYSNALDGKNHGGQAAISAAQGKAASKTPWLRYALYGLGGLLGLGVFLFLLAWLRDYLASRPKTPRAPRPPKAVATASIGGTSNARSAQPGPAADKPAAKPVAKPVSSNKAPARVSDASIVLIGGALSGRRVSLRAPISIGKAADLTLPISDDPTVSTRHCEVGLDGEGVYLHDLGSTNGSFVNNQRVASGSRARLSDGDIVRLGGNTQFKVRVDA